MTRSGPRRQALFRTSFHRVLDVLDLRYLNVLQMPVPIFDPPDIDGVDDVAGFGIDRNRAAWAFPLHAFCRVHQRLAFRLPLCLLQSLVNQVHPVIAPDGEEVRFSFKFGHVRGNELLIHGGVVGDVIMECGDDPTPASPIVLSAFSSDSSPCPMILIFLGSSPRSSNVFAMAPG